MKKNYQRPELLKKSKLNIPFISMFLADSGGISSKRVAGLLGWLCCIIIFIWAFITSKEVPEYGDLVVIMSSSLLGIDSVTLVFLKRVNK